MSSFKAGTTVTAIGPYGRRFDLLKSTTFQCIQIVDQILRALCESLLFLTKNRLLSQRQIRLEIDGFNFLKNLDISLLAVAFSSTGKLRIGNGV